MTSYFRSGFFFVASRVPHLNSVLFCWDYQYCFKICSNATQLWITLHVCENMSKYRKRLLTLQDFIPV